MKITSIRPHEVKRSDGAKLAPLRDPEARTGLRDGAHTLPLLLVDVDGVLSLFGFAPDAVPEGVWAQVEGIGHRLSTPVATRLRALEGVFEPVWCTGWEEKANENLPHLLGLGPWPVIELDRRRGVGMTTPGAWKLAAIDEFAGPDRSLAWIDDVLDATCEAWAARRPGPTLLVRTRAAEGLTDAHTERLRAWAEEVRARSRL